MSLELKFQILYSKSNKDRKYQDWRDLNQGSEYINLDNKITSFLNTSVLKKKEPAGGYNHND